MPDGGALGSPGPPPTFWVTRKRFGWRQYSSCIELHSAAVSAAAVAVARTGSSSSAAAAGAAGAGVRGVGLPGDLDGWRARPTAASCLVLFDKSSDKRAGAGPAGAGAAESELGQARMAGMAGGGERRGSAERTLWASPPPPAGPAVVWGPVED